MKSLLRQSLTGIAACLAFVIQALAGPLTPAFAQMETGSDESGSASGWHFRYELFQMLLEQKGLRNTYEVRELLEHPEESVIVVLGGTREIGRTEWEQFRSYVSSGGVLLIASDRDNSILGLRAGPVQGRNATQRYLGYSDVLEITEISLDHPLTAGLGMLVVNKSGWINNPPSGGGMDWKTLASLPDDCAPSRSSEQPLLMVGVPRNPDQGLIVLCSDHSIFTNSMLWHGDNASFAVRVSDYLYSSGRSRLLFAVDGVPQGSYQNSPFLSQPLPATNPLPETPQPNTPTDMLRLANRVLRETEEMNVLNEILRDQPRRVNPWAYLRFLLFILVLLIMFWLVRTMLRSNGVPFRFFPQRRMLSALAMNADAHKTPDALGAAAEVLSRNFCIELCNSADPSVWNSMLRNAEQLPSGQPLARSQRKGLVWLLDLAVDGHRRSLSHKEFRKVGQLISQIRMVGQMSPQTTV